MYYFGEEKDPMRPDTNTLPKRLVVVKGCPALQVKKGERLTVYAVELLGHGHYAVRFRQVDGRERCLYGRLVRHPVFNLNNGDPTKAVRVRRVA